VAWGEGCGGGVDRTDTLALHVNATVVLSGQGGSTVRPYSILNTVHNGCLVQINVGNGVLPMRVGLTGVLFPSCVYIIISYTKIYRKGGVGVGGGSAVW
jgi:hypothetical protein